MSPTFDPYYKWLAIPPAEQPPNHYRLLALNLFESDSDVIATAADQRMAHVRSFQSGQYVDASQRLLNELASARLCLLRADKKAVYDAELGAKFAIQAARAVPPPVPPLSAMPIQEAPTQVYPAYQAEPSPATFVAETDQPDAVEAIAAHSAAGWQDDNDPHDNDPLGLADPTDRYPKRSAVVRPRKSSFPKIFLLAPLVGIAAVVATVAYNNLRDATDQPEGADVAARTEKPIKHPIEPPLHSAGSGRKSDHGLTKTTRTSDFTPQFSPSDDATSSSSIGGSDPFAAGNSTPEDSSLGTRGEEKEKKPTAARLPVPDAEAQRKALVEIKNVYKSEFAKVGSVEGRAALAKKLGELADNPKEDPTLRYVMATQSLDIAVKLCDAKLASNVVRDLCFSYDVDSWELRAKTLAQLALVAKTPEARQLIAGGAYDLVEKSLAEEKYDAAVQLATTASELAMTLPGVDFRKKTRDSHARALRLREEATEVQAAQDRLGRQSDDAAAHLLIGRFFCMERDDWDSGLPHLARGGDADLSAMARRELAGAAQPADQVALADAWWELADRRRDAIDAPLVKGMRNRAVYWYRRALPQLSGFAQSKAQKRIAEATAVIPAKP